MLGEVEISPELVVLGDDLVQSTGQFRFQFGRHFLIGHVHQPAGGRNRPSLHPQPQHHVGEDLMIAMHQPVESGRISGGLRDRLLGAAARREENQQRGRDHDDQEQQWQNYGENHARRESARSTAAWNRCSRRRQRSCKANAITAVRPLGGGNRGSVSTTMRGEPQKESSTQFHSESPPCLDFGRISSDAGRSPRSDRHRSHSYAPLAGQARALDPTPP